VGHDDLVHIIGDKKIDCVIVVTGESTIPLLDVLSKYAMT